MGKKRWKARILLCVLCLSGGGLGVDPGNAGTVRGVAETCVSWMAGTRVQAAAKKTKELTKSVKAKKAAGKDMTDQEKKALSTASFKLFYQTLLSEGADANVLISPTSIQYAFGMAENGAKGKTKSQLEKAVSGGLKTKQLNQALARVRRRMESSERVKWNVANSIWYVDRKDVKVKKSYLKKMKSYYGAQIYKAKFDKQTVKDLNRWVKKQTRGMIPKLVDQMRKDEVMYLVNAMAFEAEWGVPVLDYQVQKDQDFHNQDGSISKATMLNCEQGSYLQIGEVKGFQKYYAGGAYSFAGFELPENMTAMEFAKMLADDGSLFTDALANRKSAQVWIRFPEFQTDYSTDLAERIKELGAVNAFDPEKANLYNMFEKDIKGNYYFTKALHKTHIEVDRKGTKAAAVTAVVAAKATAMLMQERVEITLDHPFVYAIVDDEAGLPIFIGCLNRLE